MRHQKSEMRSLITYRKEGLFDRLLSSIVVGEASGKWLEGK